MFTTTILTVFSTFALAIAAPAPVPDAPIALTPAQLAAFAPYTQFARAAYCRPRIIAGWQCGQACDAIPGFEPTMVGGDGNFVQFHFVGYWPAENSVVVAHQGTDPEKLFAVLTDANIVKIPLNPKHFPHVPPGVRVHSGFQIQQAITAPAILAEVKRILSAKNATRVTIVGHSLGGALAQLDALYMTLNLEPTIAVHAITYGTPRVGNSAYAAFFDATVSNFTRVNNKRDIVPVVPPKILGFTHPRGEVHLLGPGRGVACPGDDDAVDALCQIRTVPDLHKGSFLDHLGPYEGILIGTLSCKA